MKILTKELNLTNTYTNFEKNGYKVIQHGIHPVIVFYNDYKVWYLEARSAYDKANKTLRKKQLGEIEIQNNKSLGLSNSYVDTRSIHIMDRKEFETIFGNNWLTNSSLDIPKSFAKDIYKQIISNINQNKITIQNIRLNNKNEAYNEIIYTSQSIDKISKIALKNKPIDNDSDFAIQTKNFITTTLERIINLNDEQWNKFNQSLHINMLPIITKQELNAYNISEILKAKSELREQFGTPRNTIKNKL